MNDKLILLMALEEAGLSAAVHRLDLFSPHMEAGHHNSMTAYDADGKRVAWLDAGNSLHWGAAWSEMTPLGRMNRRKHEA